MVSEEELKQAFENIGSRDSNVRLQAMGIIRRAGARSAEGLLKLLLSDNGYLQDVAQSFLWAFFRDEDYLHPNTVETILQAIQTTEFPLVQSDGLGFLTDILWKYPNTDLEEKILELAKSEDETLREAVAECLPELRSVDVLPCLRIFLDDTDWVSKTAVESLRRINTKESLAVLEDWERKNRPNS